MKRVYITFAERPTAEYPLAVVLLDDAPGAQVPRSQDHSCRSMQEARLFANGMCAGGRWAGQDDWPVNPEVDPRLRFRDDK